MRECLNAIEVTYEVDRRLKKEEKNTIKENIKGLYDHLQIHHRTWVVWARTAWKLWDQDGEDNETDKKKWDREMEILKKEVKGKREELLALKKEAAGKVEEVEGLRKKVSDMSRDLEGCRSSLGDCRSSLKKLEEEKEESSPRGTGVGTGWRMFGPPSGP